MNSSEAALLEQRKKAGFCIQCGMIKTHKIYLGGMRRKLVRESGLFVFFYSMGKFSLEEGGVGDLMDFLLPRHYFVLVGGMASYFACVASRRYRAT